MSKRFLFLFPRDSDGHFVDFSLEVSEMQIVFVLLTFIISLFASFNVTVVNVDSTSCTNVTLGVRERLFNIIVLDSSVVLLSSVLESLSLTSINSLGKPISSYIFYILFKHFLTGFFLFLITYEAFLIIIQASIHSLFLFSSNYNSNSNSFMT